MIIYDNPPQAESHKPFYRKKKTTPIWGKPIRWRKTSFTRAMDLCQPNGSEDFRLGIFIFFCCFVFFLEGGGGRYFFHREKSLCSFSATGLMVVTCFSLVVFWSQKMHEKGHDQIICGVLSLASFLASIWAIYYKSLTWFQAILGGFPY